MSGLNVTVYAHLRDGAPIEIGATSSSSRGSVVSIDDTLTLFVHDPADLRRLGNAITARLAELEA